MTYTIVIHLVLIPILLLIPFELATKWIHQYIMHGPGWVWHRSHHEHHDKTFEKNDLYALCFAALSIGLFYLAREVYQSWWIASFATGLTLYGAFYFFVHDYLIHRRIPNRLVARLENPYIKRLVRAHAIHHKTTTKNNCESFGFLYAPPKYAFPTYKPVKQS